MLVKRLRNNKLGGYSSYNPSYSDNRYLAQVMKDVNTVRIETLSPDQIEQARARRSKERANHRLSLDEIDLPQNHPWATKAKMSPEDDEKALQNLRARSMRRRNYDAMQEGGGGHGGGAGGLGRQR